jgi:glycosyltransferase involved in cell wall biosynthesis
VPKKILIVITKGDVGGAQMLVYNLARGLKQKGLDVAVGMGEGTFLRTKLSEEQIPIVHFKYLQRNSNPFALIFFIFELKSFLKKERYDAVQFNSSNSLPGALGVKLADHTIKTVFTVHGLSVLDKNYKASGAFRMIYRLFFKFFLGYVDMPVFVDHHDLEEACALGIVKNGTLIYNGLDEDAFHFMPKDIARRMLSEKIGRDASSLFVIGSIGRLSYQKNYEFLIRSFSELLAIAPNAIAVIIGEGPKRPLYETLIKELRLEDRIILLGEIPDASGYLKAFDLFILPSRYEGLPITLTECLFAGVPVLASNVGGNREVANERSLYALDDKADFLKKFSTARKDLSGNLCDADKKGLFSLKKMTEDYSKLFEKP